MSRRGIRACLKSPYSAATAAFALILRGLRLTSEYCNERVPLPLGCLRKRPGLRACSPQPTASHGKIDAFATKGDFKQALKICLRGSLFPFRQHRQHAGFAVGDFGQQFAVAADMHGAAAA